MLRRKLKKTDENLFLQEGAPVLSDRLPEPIDWTTICVRLPQKYKNTMAQILKEKRLGMTMNAYVLEAIQEKMLKDQEPS